MDEWMNGWMDGWMTTRERPTLCSTLSFLMNVSNTGHDGFPERQHDRFTYLLFLQIAQMCSICMRCSAAAEVHVIRPQAGAAAGRVKGVGLEPAAVVVFNRRRHVDPLLSSAGWLDILKQSLIDGHGIISQEAPGTVHQHFNNIDDKPNNLGLNMWN